jgi:hypothetical protein
MTFGRKIPVFIGFFPVLSFLRTLANAGLGHRLDLTEVTKPAATRAKLIS